MLDDVFDDEPIPNEEGDHEEHQLVTINFGGKTSPPASPTSNDVTKDTEVRLPGNSYEGASKV